MDDILSSIFTYATAFILGIVFTVLSGIIRFFKIRDTYDRYKQHQKELLNSLERLLKPERGGLGVGGSESHFKCPDQPREFDEFLLQHLESGYPQIVEITNTSRDFYMKCYELRQKLVESVKNIVFTKYDEFEESLDRMSYDVSNFVKCVLSEMEYRLLWNKEKMGPSKTTSNGKFVLKINGTEVARSAKSNVMDELAKFYYDLLQYKELIRIASEIIKIRENYDSKNEVLNRGVKELIDSMKHGKDLEGECELCPKLIKYLKFFKLK